MANIMPITYKLPSTTTTASGGQKVTYTSGETDYAEVKNLNEKFENITGQPVQQSTMEFKVKYRESLAINEDWLIGYFGVDYKISTIQKVGERNFKYRIV